MTTEQFFNLLKTRGLLSEEALTRLQREVILSGKSPEELISQQRLVDDAKVAEAKAQVFKIPYRKIDFTAFDDSLLKIIPEETARTYGVAPFSKKDSVLVVGMVQPDDLKAQDALKFIAHESHLNLGVVIISYSDWQQVMRKYSPYKSEVQEAIQALHLKSSDDLVSLDKGSTRQEDAPIIRIVADTLREAVSGGASDIHIEPQQHYLRVRFRVDGDLKEAASLPAEVSALVISRIKILSNLKIDENRMPQDGRFRSKVFDREIDFRVATFPTPLGEKVAIRILDPTTGLKSFDALGLIGSNLALIQKGLEKPYGMILVTGPTGSGKSTTLYAFLQQLNRDNVNIVSLEDPVEYFVSGINQSQVRPEIGYDFASGLRQILRQDPDVIMVGEIRDIETAGLAVNAALTGHIVLSTLHTNNAAGVIPRLLDMKIEPFLISASLNLMIGQRLVSVLCASCKKGEIANPELAAIVEKTLHGLPDELTAPYKNGFQIFHAPGCSVCHGRGVTGRIAIFEVIAMTDELEEVISQHPSLPEIIKA
ncbi:MAG: hypothetical protein RIQ54_128, partial [Candidatus Parcubacteria bacterium]